MTKKGHGRAKAHLIEESILFLSVVKWSVLSIAIGLVVGATTAIFLKTLDFGIANLARYNRYYLLIPIGMLLSYIIGRYIAPEAEGHGTEKVIEAIHLRSGWIPLKVMPVKFVTTVITLATGGSVGKEGPCAQIGASLASAVSNLIRLDNRDRRRLVICGISAGFAAVFGTPIAGAMFGLEVLFLGKVLYDVIFPSFVAGIVSYQISHDMGTIYFHHTIDFVPQLTGATLFTSIIGGIVFGLMAFLLIEVMEGVTERLARLKLNSLLKPLLCGFVIIPLALFFSGDSVGLGLNTISSAINGEKIPIMAPFWKILFTSLTLAGGGSGGIVTPIFFIGATTGNLLGHIMGIDPGTLAAIGMVSLVAGATNTPIASSIMSIELFGPKIGVYAAIACITSFLIVGHRSVYPSQVIGLSKSSSLKVPIQKDVETGEEGIEFTIRAKSLTGMLVYLWLKTVRYLQRKNNSK